MAALFYRGGVLKDVLGPGRVLEDTFSSPRKLPRPRLKDSTIFEWLKFCKLAEKCFSRPFVFFEIDGKKNLRPFFLGKHLHLCPWSLALASSIPVLGLGFFLCPWPWPRALCPRLHLCYFMLTLLSHLL